MIRLVLPYPPSNNRVWRVGRNGTVYKNPVAAAYQRQARMTAIIAGVSEPLRGPIHLWLELHPKQPKKMTQKPLRCLDLDNALKVTLDALNGVAWLDDRQVVEMHARRGEPIDGGQLVVTWEAA